jgi:hypothetical protein
MMNVNSKHNIKFRYLIFKLKQKSHFDIKINAEASTRQYLSSLLEKINKNST